MNIEHSETTGNSEKAAKYKQSALIILLVSNAILISLLELLIPIPVPVPGVKLGLANIITIIAIVFLGTREVLAVVSIRCIVVALLSRGVMTLAFSLSGGIISALLMLFLYRSYGHVFSLKGISIAGALIHNTVQLLVASILLGQMIILYYLPVLWLSAVITGWIVGSIAERVLRELERKGILYG